MDESEEHEVDFLNECLALSKVTPSDIGEDVGELPFHYGAVSNHA